MTDSQKQPLFVVGPLRSGTTFLRLILGMHPDISMVGEFEEAVHELEDTGWPSAGDYRRYLETQRAFAAKKLTVDPTLTTYRAIVEDFWRQLAARGDRPILGASIHSRFDRCPDIWPDAKYIHLLRDPRDVARSCIGNGWVGNVYFGANYWLEAEQRWDLLVERTRPEQRFEIRYEHLVRSPVEELTALCQFIGVPYAAALLNYPEHTTYGPPDQSLAEQWRRKLTPREVWLAESRTAPLMVRRGYAPVTDAHPPSPLEKMELLVHDRIGRAKFGIKRYGLPLWLRGRVGKLLPDSTFGRSTRLRLNEIDTQHLR